MRNKDKKLTSVRLDPTEYQELASRAIFLYLTDKEFKLKVHKQK